MMKKSGRAGTAVIRLRCLLLLFLAACMLPGFSACTRAVEVLLPKTAVSLAVGDTYTIHPVGKPAKADTAFSYVSSDAAVAKVDANGLVTAVTHGKATVTVSGGGGAAVLAVTVAPAASASSALAVSDPSWTNRQVSVLMYHSINKVDGNNLCIPPALFDSEMAWLKSNGYTALSMDELYAHMSAGTALPDKVVVITLDDGYDDNYINAYPILKKHGLKATVFMISDKIGTAGYLSAGQIKEMSQNGVDIEDHTVTHSHLNQESYSRQIAELKDSKTAIEQITGKTVSYVSYPYGDYDADTLRAVKATGYKLAFRENGGTAKVSDPQLEVPRKYVSAAYSLKRFTQVVQP